MNKGLIKELGKTLGLLANKITEKFDEQPQVYSVDEVNIPSREVGGKAELVGKDGELSPIPDGPAELSDGFKFTVKDGLITSIEGEVTQTDNVEAETTPTDNSTPDTSIEEIKNKVAELDATTQSIKSDIQSLIETVKQMQEANQSFSKSDEFSAVKTAIDKLSEAVLTIEKTPAEFSKTNTSNDVKVEKEEKLFTLARVMNSIKETK